MEIIKNAEKRSNADNASLIQTVGEIVENIKTGGDDKLISYNKNFDNNERTKLQITQEEIEEAYSMVSSPDIEDIKKAKHNIEAFAQVQKEALKEIKSYEISPGITLGHRIIPVHSCLCYVPGGGYPLYSTALMLAVPAQVAGVKRITACSPARKGTGKIHPKTLVALDIAGVHEIYAVGGAHAIAAFSYGTDQIKAVDLIVGPGNQYVTEAKRQCYGQVGIDFVAGPSEVLVIADESANAAIIAADLLAQSEHDLLAKGILVTTSRNLAEAVIEQVEFQLAKLPTKNIASPSWHKFGEVILADNLDEAINIANDFAPEHLEVIVSDKESVVPYLMNYGSLFIGQYTAEVFGDYTSGTNHTLPTLKAARYTGGVWVGTFLKVCTHQSITKEAMAEMSPLVSRLARGEGLISHARAAEIRVELAKEV